METKFIALMIISLMCAVGFTAYQKEETKRECIRTPGCRIEVNK